MTETDTFTIDSAAVAWRETGDEIVVLDLSGSVYFGLNNTGAQLWKRLVTGATRAELAELLGASTQAPLDVDSFLTALDEYGLLQARDCDNTQRPM